MMNSLSKLTAVVALAVLVTGCGSAKNAASTSAGTAATTPAATAAVTTPAAGGAMTTAAGMMAPASMHCGATKPVWANTKTKVYHMVGDAMYGKTKHGKFMCASAAKAAGYHASGGMMMKKTKKNDNDGDAQ